MFFFPALLLGLLQGLTEFLPISSSAHLILLPWFLGWSRSLVDSLTFDVALHAGTLLAVLWYFWRDWVGLLRALRRLLARRRPESSPDRLVLYLLLATIPAAVAGFLLQKVVEDSFRHPALILVPLVLVSLLMIFAERRFRPLRGLEGLRLQDSLLIGLAQALALLPGVSRSGITITAGLLKGYEREGATRFSFLLSTPVIAGAALLHLKHFFSPEILLEWRIFAAGMVSSALVGYLAIAFLMRYLRRHTLNGFAFYRLALAAFILFWLFWRN